MSALVGTLSALAAAPSATLLVQSRVAACVNFTAGSNCTWWADKVLSNGAPFFGTLDGQTGAASTIAGVSAKFRTFMSGSDVNIVSVGNGTALLANADVNQSSPGGFGFHDTLIWIDTEGGTVVPVEEIRAGAASSLGSPVWRELAPVGNGTGKPSMLEWRHTVMYPSMDTYEELSYFAAPGAIRPPASIESTVLWSRSTNGSTGSAAAAGRDAVVGLGDKRAIVKGSALLYAQYGSGAIGRFDLVGGKLLPPLPSPGVELVCLHYDGGHFHFGPRELFSLGLATCQVCLHYDASESRLGALTQAESGRWGLVEIDQQSGAPAATPRLVLGDFPKGFAPYRASEKLAPKCSFSASTGELAL